VKQRMLFATLAVMALASPVLAEPIRLAQAGASELLPPHEIITIIQSTGFDPIGQPIRRGPNYVLRAIDEYDREVNLVVSARSGEVLSVKPIATASRMPPPRDGATIGPYGQTPPGYIPPPGSRGVYSAGPPIIDEDDEPPVYAPRPPAPVPGALPRSGYAARPPAAGAMPPDEADGPPPTSEPRVITSTEPDRNRVQGGALPPPPERFPQRAVAPPPGKPKPPVKRAAAVPQQAPLPRPKPQAKGDAALPPSPAMEMAPPPPPAPESKPADSVPN
jgi:hypothetical protein